MSIRIKLLIVGMLFMMVPILAYEFITDMKDLGIKGQEQALMLEAQSVVSVLNNLKSLIDNDTEILLSNSNNLYVQPAPNKIVTDGYLRDWSKIIHYARYIGYANLQSGDLPESDYDASFWYLLAYDKDYFHVLLQVNDDDWLVDSDSFRISFGVAGDIKNYIIEFNHNKAPKMFVADSQWNKNIDKPVPFSYDMQLDKVSSGYNLELKLPLELILKSGYLSLYLVDNDKLNTLPSILNSNSSKISSLNKVVFHSPQIVKMLTSFDKVNGKIWVLDKYLRVRGVVGKFYEPTIAKSDSWGSWISSVLFKKTKINLSDYDNSSLIRTNSAIKKALTDKAAGFVRVSKNGENIIIGAAVPIKNGKKVTGVVVVEKSNADILALENITLANVIKRVGVILLLAIISIVWFTVRITSRINRLQAETNLAINKKGTIRVNSKITVHSKDELGKLAASIAHMLDRLAQHSNYLERMPITLRHEILNPLNVIQTSIENLSNLGELSSKQEKYIKSSKIGIRRLGSILHSLTEASNLEEALTVDNKEKYNLTELIDEYFDNYKQINSKNKFEIKNLKKPLILIGWPESIAQVLDKILDNAIDFSVENKPISIVIDLVDKKQVCIQISNYGQNIPPEIRVNLFESMVSKRLDDNNKTTPHLGVGLYIAKVIIEEHGGELSVLNLSNPSGVKFLICLPVDSVN